MLPEEARKRQDYWRARDEAFDRWMLIYLLYDEAQRKKPQGFTQFETDMPQAIVNRGIEILTANPLQWHVLYDREHEEERELIRKVERFGEGLFEDINDLQMLRGLPEVEQDAAFYALVRGWVCSENTLTHKSGRDNGSPVWFNLWDMRWVYPEWKYGKGLDSVLYTCSVPLAEVVADYPHAEVDERAQMDQEVTKYIWYDRKQYLVACDYFPRKGSNNRDTVTLLSVTEKEERPIPVTIIPANGISAQTVPSQYRATWTDERNTGATTGRRDNAGMGIRSWSANRGRSIFATVERAIPQFNDYISNLLQAVKLYAYPTVVHYTRGGNAREVSIGTGMLNTLEAGIEDLRFMQNPSVPPGMEGALSTLGRELAMGLVDPALLQQTQAMSGFDRAQIINLALNALGPWARALDRWQVAVAQDYLRQMRDGEFTLSLAGGTSPDSFFEVRFEPGEIQRKYRLRVQRTPALPDDMAQRVGIAQQLKLGGLASMRTIFDRVLNFPDPDGEIKKMFEDAANQVPAVVSKRIEDALVEMGLDQYVPLARNQAVIEEFMQYLQLSQLQQAAGAMGGGNVMGGTPAPGGAGMPPEGLPPEMGQPLSENGRMGEQPVPAGAGGY